MATATRLLTVEEFRAPPQPAAGWRQELHHGELIEVLPPKHLHIKVRRCVVNALNEVLGSRYSAATG